MLFSSITTTALALFASGALAGCVQKPPPGSSTKCYTRVASTSGPHQVPTSYSTTSTPCVSTRTVKTTVTKTSAPVISTVTSTTTKVTTEKGSKVTSTVTKTKTASITTTETKTAVETTTTTTSVLGASTIAAAAAFTPVQSSLPGATYDGLIGGLDPVGARDISPRKNRHFGFGGQGHTYPQDCKCNVWVPGKCSTTTVTSTATTTAKPSTKTNTVTETVTSTVVLSATKTITTITTTTNSYTITATQTSTSTETDTVTTSTTTLYAACATPNFADAVYGAGIGGVAADFPNVDVADADTAYECCAAALTDPFASGSVIWAWAIGGGEQSCQIGYETNSCPNPASETAEAVTGLDFTYVVGNGYCGSFTSTF